MGASPSNERSGPRPAALMSTQAPEVTVEEAADGDDTRVLVEGTMYHSGLNKNAWGLTEAGAQSIANDLVGKDYTASHPFIRGSKYDRAIAEGQGTPIGEVLSTNVIDVGGASLGTSGSYTAEYVAEVTDRRFAEKLTSGLMLGEGYGTSIGIYADPEVATCSVCDQNMASDDCNHSRGQEVEIEKSDGSTETQIAGPLYSDGESDHLAHVWMPAYEGADVDVSAAAEAVGASDRGVPQGATVARTAEAVLAEPFDATEASEDERRENSTDQNTENAYSVRVPREASGVAVSEQTAAECDLQGRGSYRVAVNNND